MVEVLVKQRIGIAQEYSVVAGFERVYEDRHGGIICLLRRKDTHYIFGEIGKI